MLTRAPADPDASPAVFAAPDESRAGRDLLPLIALALLLGLACRGHFVKPHGDFYELREIGHSLLCGELPATLKRAPVFPVLVAGTGTLLGAILVTETPADQLAAGWINALCLPCSVALAYLIGRRWLGGGARWVAVWVAVLPAGLYCTAHVLIEPLLVAGVLLTVWLAQRGSKWAYLAAAVASMTRYDAAGLLIGVGLADLLRRQRPKLVITRMGLASVPLVLWLALTAVTWETRSDDHYLRQIGERWNVDAAWPLATTLRCIGGSEGLTVPVWAAEWEPWLRVGLDYAIVVAALLGAGLLLWHRDGGALTAAAMFIGYVLVHAVFPFRFFRFGYPPAPLVLLAAGVGVQFLATRLPPGVPGRAVRGLLLVLVAGPLAVVLYGEATRLGSLLSLTRWWSMSLPYVAFIGVALVWATAWPGRRNLTARIVVGLALAVLVLVQVRRALPLLGDGRERINVVRAARWVRDHTSAEVGLLSDEPGILRMYADDRPPGRFIGLGEIVAEEWPAILTECRRRGVAYVIWHDQVFAEQGAYYIRKWRLDRFAALSEPERVPGVVVEMRYEGQPRLWILRLLPE